jgi:hypothetical protein
MDFLRGALRPFEQARGQWSREENLEGYFDIARDVLVKAGVAFVNQHFDPNVPYSKAVFITAPQRICSYD